MVLEHENLMLDCLQHLQKKNMETTGMYPFIGILFFTVKNLEVNINPSKNTNKKLENVYKFIELGTSLAKDSTKYMQPIHPPKAPPIEAIAAMIIK